MKRHTLLRDLEHLLKLHGVEGVGGITDLYADINEGELRVSTVRDVESWGGTTYSLEVTTYSLHKDRTVEHTVPAVIHDALKRERENEKRSRVIQERVDDEVRKALMRELHYGSRIANPTYLQAAAL